MSSGSKSNTSQWPPYPSYIDCSQSQCNIYCPQWCYIFPPPPRFDIANDDDRSSSLANDFSPLIIAVIGVMATAFLLITYLTFISKHCRTRGHDRNSISPEFETSFNSLRSSSGLDEAMIKSIGLCKYKKDDGFVDGTECSVCLGEFEDDEKLRLLPKCSHAFHVSCIDTWLQSHATCPLCRCAIFAPQLSESETVNPELETIGHVRHDDTVLEVEDLEAIVAEQQQQQQQDHSRIRNAMDSNNQCTVQITRSEHDRISIADDDQEASAARSHVTDSNEDMKQFNVRNTDAVTRSVSSTGRAMLDKWRHGHIDKDSSTTDPPS